MRHLVRLLPFAFYLLPFAFPAILLANGGYKSSITLSTNPKIPTQRALILHKDNTETLIVESAFDTPSDKVAWLLPLPAEPTHLAPADPGLLPSLSLSLRPYVATDSSGVIPIAGMLLLAACITVLYAFAPGLKRHISLVSVLVALGFVFLLVNIFLPTLSRGTVPGATLLSTHRVGNYTVSVLRPQSSDTLSTWLTENALAPLTPAERPIIDDYIKRNWVFAAAVLTRDPATGTLATPHPISATFPAKDPVFPMKLTAIANTPTRVDLFIASDKQYFADWFETAAALTFTAHPDDGHRGPFLKSDVKDLTIGHPDAVALIPTGSIVTRLTADLPVKAMDHDISFTPTDYIPYRQYFATKEVRRDRTIAALIAFACLPIAWLGLVRRNRRPMLPPDRAIFRILLFLTPFAAVCTWFYTPVTDAAPTRVSRFEGRTLPDEVSLLVESAQITPSTTPAELASLLSQHVKTPNPFTNKPVTLERSPGNLSLRTLDDTPCLCTYDINGVEHRHFIHPTTQPTTSSTQPAR